MAGSAMDKRWLWNGRARSWGILALASSLYTGFLGGCSDVTAPEDRRIGPDGGLASLEGGAVTLQLPAGALAEPVWFTSMPTTLVPSTPLLLSGTTYEIGPPGTVFARPVRLTIAYDPEEIPAGFAEEDLGLFQLSGASWILLNDGAADPQANQVSGTVAFLGRYGVMGLDVVGVDVSPAADTVAPGGSSRLLAAPKGVDGRTLTGPSVAWSSSDTLAVRVDSTGLVTGVGEGSATITATAGAFSTTATVVTRKPVGSVDITPASSTLAPGGTLQLTGTVRDASGLPLSARVITWTSTDPQVATVTPTGLVEALRIGSVTITASSEGKTGTATLSVHGDLEIVTSTLATGVVGIPYDQALAATGGNGSYRWSVAQGALPSGLVLNAYTGDISGTPLQAGVDTISVQVSSSAQQAEKTLSITISPLPVASVTLSPITAEMAVGDTLSFSVTPRDAQGNILSGRASTWASSDEDVAAVDEGGTVTGVAEGSVTIVASVEGFPAWASVTVWNSLAINDSTLVEGGEGTLYSDTLSATGGDGDYTWSISADSLPGGLSLVDSTGVVRGTPTEAETRSFTVLVESGDGQADSVRVSMTIREVLSIATSTLAQGVQGSPYSETVAAEGGRPPLTWSVIAGALPSGLVLGVDDGVIYGTPTGSGDSNFTLEVESDDGQTASRALIIQVSRQPVASVTVSPTPGVVTLGQDLQLAATLEDALGTTLTGRAIAWSTADGGIASVSTGGLVTGTGVGTTTITATSEGVSGTAVITVHGILGVTTGILAGGATGVAYNQALAASGGNGTYTWTLSAGALPGGLSLDGSTGIISGTPAGPGVSGFTVQVTSGDGQVATRALSITIS